jgi:RNA recognition motif-containing protein
MELFIEPLLIDKITCECKGTAFVKFQTKEMAAKCLLKTGEQRTGAPLLINGRPCRVDLAVDKDSAEKLKSETKLRVDKRHLYLSNEGQIVTDSSSSKKRKAEPEK